MNLLFSKNSLIFLIPGIALTLGCIVTTDELAETTGFTGSGAASSSGGFTGSGAAPSTGGGNALATGGGDALATGGGDALATGGGDALATGGGDALATGGGDGMIASETACDDSTVTFACVDFTGTDADLSAACGAGTRATSCPTDNLQGTCTVGAGTTAEIVSYYYAGNAFTEADCTTAMGVWAAAL